MFLLKDITNKAGVVKMNRKIMKLSLAAFVLMSFLATGCNPMSSFPQYEGDLSAQSFLKYISNPVVQRGVPGTYDDISASGPTIIALPGQYRMYYSALHSDTTKPDGYRTIGTATSNDGLAWTKNNAPVIEEGNATDFDSNGVMDPTAILDSDGVYKIWYLGLSNAGFEFGLATSADGVVFEKKGSVFQQTGGDIDAHGIFKPSVVKVNQKYFMAYQATDLSNVTRILLASSDDGVAWTRIAQPMLEVSQTNIYENMEVTAPSLLVVTSPEGRTLLHLYYAGLGLDTNGLYIGPNIMLAGLVVGSDYSLNSGWVRHVGNPILMYGSWPCVILTTDLASNNNAFMYYTEVQTQVSNGINIATSVPLPNPPTN